MQANAWPSASRFPASAPLLVRGVALGSRNGARLPPRLATSPSRNRVYAGFGHLIKGIEIAKGRFRLGRRRGAGTRLPGPLAGEGRGPPSAGSHWSGTGLRQFSPRRPRSASTVWAVSHGRRETPQSRRSFAGSSMRTSRVHNPPASPPIPTALRMSVMIEPGPTASRRCRKGRATTPW
jgi:hypothetical protein